MKLILFEDDGILNLEPLVLTRSVFELRCGGTTLFRRAVRSCNFENLELFVRPCLADVTAERFGRLVPETDLSVNIPEGIPKWKDAENGVLIINGRFLAFEPLCNRIESNSPVRFTSGGETVALFLPRGSDFFEKDATHPSEIIGKAAESLPGVETKGRMISYPWDLLHENPEAIVRDFQYFSDKMERIDTGSFEIKIMGDPYQVLVGESVIIEPGCVMDVRNGPVILSDGVRVTAFSRIEGPCFIGEDSYILDANIREGCSFGPQCRIGGEVEESIIHGFSNKYHFGFLGHAYLGEWVNLGAGTTNSDLKNTYENVKVKLKPGSPPIDTGLTKVGSFIGDHVKTSIGTYLNTGTVIGTMVNVVGTGILSPSYIPSFSWFLKGGIRAGRGGFERFMETANAAMARRNVWMSDAERELYRKIFDDISGLKVK